MHALKTGARAGRQPTLGRTVVLVQALAALVFMGYLLVKADVRIPLVEHPYELEAVFDDASGLDPEDRPHVTVAGVEVGRVVEVRREGRRAVATVELEDEARGHVHSGTQASILPRSALNELTVEISPGDPRSLALPSGARVPPAPGASPVGSDRVTGVFDADTRAYVQLLLTELQTGVRNRPGELRSALARLGGVVDSSGRVAGALAARRTLLTRLVGHLEVIFSTLARRDTQLAGAIVAGRRTLEATARQDSQLAEATRRTPATLRQVRATLAETERLAGPLDPALTRLRPFARELPGGLRALRGTVPPARKLVSEADSLLADHGDEVADLREALTELRPASEELRPPVEKLAPILKPINDNRDGVGKLGDNFSGVFSTNDANGPILRGLGFFEPIDPRNLGAPNASGKQLDQLRLQAVVALLRVCRYENAVACTVPYEVRELRRPAGEVVDVLRLADRGLPAGTGATP